MTQAIDIWSELWEAYYGHNGFGGDTTEIYAYRLMPNCPTLNYEGDGFKSINDEVKLNAVKSLSELLTKFCKDNGCSCKVDGMNLKQWVKTIGTNFNHRCHVEIIHRKGK